MFRLLRAMILWLLRPFRRLRAHWRKVRRLTAGRPIVEHSQPKPQQPLDRPIPGNICRFGKCDWCERAAWYDLTVLSIGYPCMLRLCQQCTEQAVDTYSTILGIDLTLERLTWIKEQWHKGDSK